MSSSGKPLGSMQLRNPFSLGHGTRNFASEALKDRHPYLEPPFRHGVDPTEIADAFGNRRMVKARGFLYSCCRVNGDIEPACTASTCLCKLLM